MISPSVADLELLWLIGFAWLVVAAGLHSLAYYILGKMAP